MKYTFVVLFVACTTFIWGCSGNSTNSQTPTEINTFRVSPKETNANIENGTDDYIVSTPSEASAKNRLFIFLPGSLVRPEIYQQILQTGAENGYYSIGLSYQNDRTFTARCRNEGPDCQGNVSGELLEGQDLSDEVDISRAASIEGRIAALIQYLQEQNPQINWGQFVDDETILWNNIVIAGHSQGSNHAAYIGWHRPVIRVGMLSGPRGIADENGPIALWLQDQRKTPASRFYGFGNINDNVTDFSLMQAAWGAMDLSGAVISVDETNGPFENSNQLSTAVGGDATFNGAHGSTCVDAQTPKREGGNPEFKSVWKYMLFPD